MTNGEHLSIKRQHVIVIVSNCKRSIEFDRCSLLQIATIKPPVTSEYERLPISRPVRSLKRICDVIDGSPTAFRNIQNLKVTSNVIPLGSKVVAGGNSDPYVAKYCFLDHILIMRTNKKTNVSFVAERQIRYLLAQERIAETSH